MRATSDRSSRARRWWGCGIVVASLVAVSCSSDGGSSESTDSKAPDTAVAATTEAPADTEAAPATETPAATDAPVDTDAPADTADAAEGDYTSRLPTLEAPTGEPIVIGLVNSEGTPGLDFPDIRRNIEASFDYLNQHGGMGGRPIELKSCASKGSPETSQACAEEMAGSGVEFVMLGLDLFPGYPTYEAASLPVIGLLPILPGDYTANALFVTGGNATLAAGIAGVAQAKFDAKTVGIISADNPGANGTEAALKASLDKLGISYVSIKGGNEETDAGYQGLMKQANDSNPDVLISLYDGNGCIGTMRGRASLGIETPVLSAGTCAQAEVLDQVGDDALGWIFVSGQSNEETPGKALIGEIMSPVLGVPADEVDPSSLGLGGLGIIQALTLAQFADMMVAQGIDVTGASLYDFFKTSTGLSLWPNGLPAECGKAVAYPSICSFEFPVVEYTADGTVQPVAGFETVSAFEYLP